jgi:hypothetical protein
MGQFPAASIAQRRLGPNFTSLYRRWQASTNTQICTLNGLDVSGINPIDGLGNIITADALVQATGAKQALLNVTDATFGNRPTIEFADAEVYQTAGNFALPTTMTTVLVAEDLNAGAFSSLFESSTYYSVSNGGFVHYINGAGTYRTAFHYTGSTEKLKTSTPSVFVNVVSWDPATAGANALPLAKVNGLDETVNTTGSTAGAWRTQRIQLGGRETLGSQYWVGAVACVSIYDGLFTAAQAAAELAFWKGEYSI